MRATKYALVLFVFAAALPALAQVPYQRVVNSDSEPANWLSYGGNYYGQRFSGLKQLTPQNVVRAENGLGVSAGPSRRKCGNVSGGGRRDHVRHRTSQHGDGA